MKFEKTSRNLELKIIRKLYLPKKRACWDEKYQMFQMSDLVKLDVPYGNERSNGRGGIVIIRQLSILDCS